MAEVNIYFLLNMKMFKINIEYEILNIIIKNPYLNIKRFGIGSHLCKTFCGSNYKKSGLLLFILEDYTVKPRLITPNFRHLTETPKIGQLLS